LKNRKTFFFVWTLFLLVGCGRDEHIEVYRAPKETIVNVVKKPLHWTVPKEWKEEPAGNMRLALFSVRGNHGNAEISIVMLPGEAGGLLANINRWRGQLNLFPWTEQDVSIPGIFEKKIFSGQEMTLVDFENTLAQTMKKRMLVAFCVREAQSWFFKLHGDSNTVTEVKPAFLDFLSHLEFE
jgi:hypothetical protein